ncbi:MAG: Gfo/Idh/MocA family oxidoreductase [Kiritimatiellia bacterium]|nr:Gfo/Idh/MocA family oxidoreductase [Kiritimatiellia bacterium]
MNGKIRWGVAGSGGIARRRTIPEGIVAARNAQLAAVYDVNEQANREVADQFQASAVSSLEELLKQDINAVYIATPTYLHHDQVIQAAQTGKHVLCEKPLGMDVKQVKEMISICKKSKVKLGTAFMMRFQSQHRAAAQMIKEGKLGKLLYGRAQLSCWYPPMPGAWRQNQAQGGGGSLIDMGSHGIDLLEMFFGPVKRVSCFTNHSVHSYETEDSAVVLLEFDNGAFGTVDTYFCIPDNSSKNILELYGSRGSILCKNTIGQGPAGEMTAFLEGQETGYDAQQSRRQPDGQQPINPAPFNTYQAEIEEFSQAILDKRPCLNSAEIGLQNQKIMGACYKSALTGRIVRV